ncbi:MAG TPA: VOC family protein [Bryobacteraceae bacterium]|nr:VOC family protein [Bryobacteraceae bacterium]
MALTTDAIVETALYVANVDRAAEWYRRIFGFPIIFQQEDRLRVLEIGEKQVLLLFKEGASLRPQNLPGGTIPPHDGSGPAHMAFGMNTADAEQWEKLLTENGVEIEGRVDWGEGDRSLYFQDPDNHVLELISHDHWRKVARQQGGQPR